MSAKRHLFVLVGLVVLTVACSQTQPTPLFRPTSTPLPDTPVPSTDQPASTSPADTSVSSTDQPTIPSPSIGSPTPEGSQAEPTRPGSPTPSETFPPIIGLEPWLDGFEHPVFLTYASEAPPWRSRLLIVEKAGRILMAENGQLRAVPFLDIRDRVGSNGSEQGLLSIAFPPDFDVNAVFYVYYTDQRGNTVVSRFQLLGGDPPFGDPDSEQKMLEIDQPASNHNGGQLQFGPDGYLYIGTGDGGRAGDPWGNAQNPEALLGKILRIEVGHADTYRIPIDNPFVDLPSVHSEIWALGLRNPWRFSFDRATGDLYIADVGQNDYEEVNFQPAQSGGGENYGWNIMEGNQCFQPQRGCDSAGLTLPVAEYDHRFGCSITGGYVYRGTRYPTLKGVYVYGDFCSGLIWGLRQMASGEWSTALLLESGLGISSFGQDAAGEIYVLDYRDGTIYHLIASR